MAKVENRTRLANRTSYGKLREVLDIPDLIAVQSESYEKFHQNLVKPSRRKVEGMQEVFQEVFPIESFDQSCALEYVSYEIGKPKYGMVAVGEVEVEDLVTVTAAEVGDVLVLTKALGTGIVATAIKHEAASVTASTAAIASMTTLNRDAAEAMKSVGVRAATDVTGFGLLGHLSNLLLQSGVAAEIVAEDIPILPEVSELIAAGHIPGGTRRNLQDLEERIEFVDQDETIRLILADAQTSGGLLMAVPEERVEELMELLQTASPVAAVIGRVTDGVPGAIKVL